MNNNTFCFDNMVVAEYGITGDKLALKASNTEEVKNELISGTWYVNGESVWGYNVWTVGPIFIPSYYYGLQTNGLTLIQFIPGPSSNTLLLDRSYIEYQPTIGGLYRRTTDRMYLNAISIIDSPRIDAIYLMNSIGNDAYENYTLRVSVLLGTQHEPY